MHDDRKWFTSWSPRKLLPRLLQLQGLCVVRPATRYRVASYPVGPAPFAAARPAPAAAIPFPPAATPAPTEADTAAAAATPHPLWQQPHPLQQQHYNDDIRQLDSISWCLALQTECREVGGPRANIQNTQRLVLCVGEAGIGRRVAERHSCHRILCYSGWLQALVHQHTQPACLHVVDMVRGVLHRSVCGPCTILWRYKASC